VVKTEGGAGEGEGERKGAQDGKGAAAGPLNGDDPEVKPRPQNPLKKVCACPGVGEGGGNGVPGGRGGDSGGAACTDLSAAGGKRLGPGRRG
jgi:hypothetical protein